MKGYILLNVLIAVFCEDEHYNVIIYVLLILLNIDW